MTDQNFVELRLIYAVGRRWWWLIAGFTILAIALAWIVLSLIPPVYQASALMLVNPSKNSNTNQYNDLMAGTQLALTYSQMLKDRPVLETVISKLGLKMSADALSDQITADPVRNSQIIKLTVQDTNPERAALIANTLAQAFSKRVEELSVQRYASMLKNAQDQSDSLQAQMTDLQSKSDSLRSQKVTKDVALANQQTLLATYQIDYRSLQDSYQNLQVTVADITGKVFVVDPAQVQRSVLKANTASAVVSVGYDQGGGAPSVADQRLVLMYGQLIITQPFLQGLVDQLGLTETADELSGKISYDVVTGTQFLRLTVADPDENQALRISKALVEAFITQVKAMLAEPYSARLNSIQKQIKDMEGSINGVQTQIGNLTSEVAQMTAELDRLDADLSAVRSDYRATVQKYDQLQETAVQSSDAVIVTEPAKAPASPSQNRLLYIAIAALFGLVVGAGSAFLLNFVRGQIRTSQDVVSALNLPVLSTIGQFAKNEDELIMKSAPSSPLTEDFRVLGNKIRLVRESGSVKTLLITSPDPSEGKTIIVSNLAVSLARMGLRIVLLDADLRLPRLHKVFKISQVEGLTNSLTLGNVNGNLQNVGIEELRILSSGDVPSNPAELLSTPSMEKLLQELKEHTDLVLIDCPPVLTASDTSILASKVDGVLLVVRAGFTATTAARDAVEALRQVKAHLVGIVLNSVPNRKKGYYYHYYHS